MSRSRSLTAASSLDTLKKEAKRWLKALRAGDEVARVRLRQALPQAPPDEPGLRDVQHALAREHGLAGWTALTQQLEQMRAGGAYRDVIKPREMDSERPYGPWSSRGCDVWDAIRAAKAGDAAALRGLLARDPKLARYGEPLHFAVREGHVEAVRVLLDAGADPDAVGPGGESLIMVARDADPGPGVRRPCHSCRGGAR
jgi:uncharacterized protein